MSLGWHWSSRVLTASMLGAGAALAGIGLTGTAAWLISRAAEHPNVAALTVAIVGVRFFGISRALLRYAERLTGHDAALRQLAEIRVSLYRKLETLAPSGLPLFRRGDLLARLVDDVDSLLKVSLQVVPPYLVALIAGASTVVLLLWLLPAAGLLLACALILAATVVPTLCGWLVQRSEAALAETRGTLSTVVLDLLEGAPDLLVFGAAPDQLLRAEQVDIRLKGQARAAARTAGAGDGLTVLLGGLAFWGAMVAGVAALRHGTLAPTLLAVVVLVPLATLELMVGLPPAAGTYLRGRQSRQRLNEVLLAPDPTREPTDPLPLPSAPFTVRLSGVSARYGKAGPWALDGVDLELAPGRVVAVVGPSGAGKSTLAAVLVRFLDIESGCLSLNGVPMQRLTGASVRTVVGLCEQAAHVFDATISDNLRIARPGASELVLRDALDEVGLLDWVDELPHKLSSRVGEYGCHMSGGQRQRLILARAVLAAFPVLVLDEPTEHLDTATADALMARLLRPPPDRSVLVVTHQLAGLTEVDEILVMDGGRVVERGRYDALVERGGWFARQVAREADLIPPG
ncbi:MAG TPA: thiol reductant ABC exporter subunit CydC [Nocardioidaceae bacterium]|jgi:thiol reductant ABC exporter CydC subunit|nr:thiol reductant ABC exporter subunit CydC [Nocardioidaceae bacterium]